MKPLGVARRLLRVVPDYAKIAWWGLVRPNVGRERPLVVCQGVILRGDLDAPEDLDVLLSVRSDLRGWALPGANPDPGEAPPATLCRAVREAAGLIEIPPESKVRPLPTKAIDRFARLGLYVMWMKRGSLELPWPTA